MSHAVVFEPPEPAWVRLQRDQRDRDRLLRRCADLRAEAATVAEQVREHAAGEGGTSVGEVPADLPTMRGADATLKELTAAAEVLERRCEQLHRQLGEARTGSLVASLRDALRPSSTSSPSLGGSLPPSWREPEESAESVATRGDSTTGVVDGEPATAGDAVACPDSRQPAPPDEATVLRILGRLDPDVVDGDRRAAARLAEQLLAAADDPYAGRWVSQLRELVARSSADARRRRRDRRRAREALARVESDEFDPQLTRWLRAAAAGERAWTAELQSAVERVVADCERTAVRRQVAAAVGEVFEDLGYDVQAHPDPDDADTRRAFVRRDLGPYAVAAEVDSQQRLQLCLVRTDAETLDPVRDREVEARFCDSLDAVSEALARRGLEVRPERVIDAVEQGLPVNPRLAAGAGLRITPGRGARERRAGSG